MIIKATFKGRDSLGYQHGKEYTLRTVEESYICIERLDGSGRCPYAVHVEFAHNWDNIKIIEE